MPVSPKSSYSREDVEAFLLAKAARTEAALVAYVASWTFSPPMLTGALRYSLLGAGKRLRPALTLGAANLFHADETNVLPAACALEMIHTYSLIHDDLPAMDNDDLRRGKPTCHKAFGEATAILAGDTLLTMAFDLAAECGSCPVIRELARAAGAEGMAGGQQLDLESEGKALSLPGLQHIHALKTGALIRAAVRIGGILGGADETQIESLTRYGEELGLAFQITDDILNVVGSAETIGKPVGSDASRSKSTYPALLGIEKSRQLAEEAAMAASGALDAFGEEAAPLRGLAHYVLDRDH